MFFEFEFRKEEKKVKKSEIPRALFDKFRVGDAVKLEEKKGEERRVFRAKLRVGNAFFISEFSLSYLIVEDPDAAQRRLEVFYDGHHKCLAASPDMIYPGVPLCDVVMGILVEFWKLAGEAED